RQAAGRRVLARRLGGGPQDRCLVGPAPGQRVRPGGRVAARGLPGNVGPASTRAAPRAAGSRRPLVPGHDAAPADVDAVPDPVPGAGGGDGSTRIQPSRSTDDRSGSSASWVAARIASSCQPSGPSRWVSTWRWPSAVTAGSRTWPGSTSTGPTRTDGDSFSRPGAYQARCSAIVARGTSPQVTL